MAAPCQLLFTVNEEGEPVVKCIYLLFALFVFIWGLLWSWLCYRSRHLLPIYRKAGTIIVVASNTVASVDMVVELPCAGFGEPIITLPIGFLTSFCFYFLYDGLNWLFLQAKLGLSYRAIYRSFWLAFVWAILNGLAGTFSTFTDPNAATRLHAGLSFLGLTIHAIIFGVSVTGKGGRPALSLNSGYFLFLYLLSVLVYTVTNAGFWQCTFLLRRAASYVGMPVITYLVLYQDSKYWRQFGHSMSEEDAIKVASTIHETNPEVFDSARVLGLGHSIERLASDWLDTEEKLLLDFAELKVDHLIGTGATANVYKGSLLNKVIAIKLLQCDVLTEVELMEAFSRETRIVRSIPPHPNVVKYLGMCVQAPTLAILWEWCGRGSVYDLLVSSSLDESQKLQIAKDTCTGLKHLHEHGVVHGDIKSLNLLVSSDWVTKICDFGHSKFKATIRNKLIQHVTIGCGCRKEEEDQFEAEGTKRWAAPEVMQSGGGVALTSKADMYSFGMVLLELITERVPFADVSFILDIEQRVLEGTRPDLPELAHSDLAQLMTLCWHADPESRPTASLALQSLQPLQALTVLSFV